ncbi:MAG: hypothetical protein RMJ43_09800 [Chloroherpetonaceae bacterium]|nr:hypothetical protein [Chthonomonadaceae bacterium]MDW8208119.1 hypothetical protein [Chloroherpetonaceae bacterium]
MEERQRTLVLLGLLLAAIVCAAIFIPRLSSQEKPPPSAPGYYTGPMKNKSGRDEYATEDNRIVPKPAPVATSARTAGSTPAPNTD